jgi:putative N6-adenine-specific DNA methylase
VLTKNFDIVATTLGGLESLLIKELEQLGVGPITEQVRSVQFQGNMKTIYRLNLESRLALRFLVPVLNFHATHEDEFYKKIRRFEWSDWMTEDDTFAIDVVANSEFFTHSRYALYRCKDAIVDHFMRINEKRPSIDLENPTIRINLHINDKAVNISFDSSGRSLHMRGYRLHNHPAPLNEVLAAALVDLSGWDGNSMLIDGMTGSGTLAIEAAMKATKRAPGLCREDFGFMRWKNYDAPTFELVKAELEAQVIPAPAAIIAIEKDLSFIRMAKANAEKAGVLDNVRWITGDFLTYKPNEEGATVLLNPPYGERLYDNVEELYGEIGTHLKHSFPGCNAWIISSNMSAFKKIGLKPTSKYKLKNGKLDCDYRGYTLFSGKRLDHIKTQ